MLREVYATVNVDGGGNINLTIVFWALIRLPDRLWSFRRDLSPSRCVKIVRYAYENRLLAVWRGQLVGILYGVVVGSMGCGSGVRIGRCSLAYRGRQGWDVVAVGRLKKNTSSKQGISYMLPRCFLSTCPVCNVNGIQASFFPTTTTTPYCTYYLKRFGWYDTCCAHHTILSLQMVAWTSS